MLSIESLGIARIARTPPVLKLPPKVCVTLFYSSTTADSRRAARGRLAARNLRRKTILWARFTRGDAARRRNPERRPKRPRRPSESEIGASRRAAFPERSALTESTPTQA